MSRPAEGEIWQLVVHPAATAGLVAFIEGRGLHLFPMPVDEGDAFPTYGIGASKELLQRAAKNPPVPSGETGEAGQ